MPRSKRKNTIPTEDPIMIHDAADPRIDRPPGRRSDDATKRLLALLDNLTVKHEDERSTF